MWRCYQLAKQSSNWSALYCFGILIDNRLVLKPISCFTNQISIKNKDFLHVLPYARHYKPRLVYFFTPFPKTIYVLWPLALCMACIQERLLIKSGLWWRAYGILTKLCTELSNIIGLQVNFSMFSWILLDFFSLSNIDLGEQLFFMTFFV